MNQQIYFQKSWPSPIAWLTCCLFLLAGLWTTNLNAQCIQPSAFGTATLSGAVNGSATIGCNFGGEYGTWNSAITGYTYNFTSTIGTDYLTISAAPGGPAIAFGTQPLSWVSTVTGTIYVHVSTNPACGTANSCRDITGTTTAIFVPGCTNGSAFGTATLSGVVNGAATIGCNFAGEYGTWNGAQTGYTYNFTSTIGTDYLTIHTGSPAGPIVAAGTQPLSWVSTVTGTIYVHVNTNSACGTANSCRDITGTTTALPVVSVLTPFSGSNSITCGTNSTLCTHAGCGVTYANGADGHTIINAANSAVININGTYSTEASFDFITIYAGSGTGGAILFGPVSGSGTINYTGLPGQTLTVRFTSDGSVTSTGYNLAVTYTGSCLPPNLLVPFTGSNTNPCGTNVTLCSHAGCGVAYNNSANGSTTLLSGGTAAININGTYSTEAGFDFITIYNGVGTGGTILFGPVSGSGTINYTGLPGQILTVGFTSDGSVTSTGFSFAVTYTGLCAPPCLITASAVASPTTVCPGGVSTLTATAASNNGAVSYLWSTSETTQSISAGPGTYTVTVTDLLPANCSASATVVVGVNATTITTAATATTICNGASSTLSATQGTSSTLSWVETLVGGVTTPAQCATWDAFRASLVPAPYTSCTMSGTFDPIGRTATTPATVQAIANALKNATTFSALDGANTWVVGLACGSGCGGGVVELSADGTSCSCTSPGYNVRPNLVGSNSGGVNTATCGGPTQTITVSFSSNSVGPLTTYSWAPAAGLSCTTCATPIATPSATTTYTVTGTLSNGCTGTATITINVITIVANCSGTNASACNVNNGSASVTPSGGTAPYTYSWSNGSTNAAISDLIAGTYCVTVTDAAGCTSTCCYTVTQPTFAATAIATDASTGVTADGTVTINTITGGTAPYTYAPGNPLINLLPGSYCITVTDANGCTASACATVSVVGCVFTASCSVNSNVSCFGGNNGSATATAGGTIVGPVTYLWDNGETNATAVALNAGTHSVLLTDVGTGCVTSCSSVITQSAAIVVTGTTTSVLCAESPTGSISTNVTGGISPYTFSWSTGATTQNISGLAAGTYTVGVTDANGCITTYITSITCSDNIAPVLSAGPGSGTPLFENFEAGVLPVGWSATGLWHVTGSCSSGTPPNPTQWAYYGIDGQCNYNNGVANSGDLTSTTVSIPGTASSAKVRFRYAYNGEGGAPPTGFDNASVRMSINGGAFVQAAALSTTGSFGTWLASEFSIPAAIGGTIALQWNFSTQDGIANATLGLQVDSVAITYIDVQQCPANIVVSNDPGVCGTTVSWTPPTASDNCAVTVTSNKNPGDFFPVGTTVVTYTATDGCGNATSCSFNVTVNLVGPPILNISDTHVDVDCQGANNGSIDLTVTSIGGGPYLYLWSNGATTQDISGLFVGVYTVNVTEANGCSATYSVSIADNPPLQVTETHTDVLCNGNTNGTIDITATDGKPAYGYLWSDGVTAEDRTGLSPGTYTVTVTDQCGTSQILTIVIGEPTALSATCSLISNVSCNGGSNGSVNVSVVGGTPPYSTSPSTTGLTAGTYTFTVTDANGCTATCAATITQPTALLANTSTTAATCINTTNGSATSAPSGGTGPYTYLWSNGSTNATAINLAGGTYTVLVTDANGCTVIGSATITAVSSIPAQPGAISGNVSVCLSSTGNVYSIVAVPGATSYTWSTGSTTATITSGQGTTSIMVSFSGTAVASTISVTANNVCGSSIARFKSYKVTAALTLPGPIAGQKTGLCKKLNVPYSIAAVPGAISYFWAVPGGVTIVSGQGSTAIVVNYNNAFTGTGNITVQAVNSCTMSAARLLAVSAKAAKPIIIGSNTTCQFQTGVVYSVTPVVGATSYTWTVVPGSSIVSGQGTTSIVVNWGNINGVIKCKGNNLCGSGLDGTLPVSFTCKEDGSALDISELALYPNPTDNLATLDFDAFVDGNATLIITDMVGRVVSTENFDVTEGNNKRTIDVNQYAKGTYLIKVSCEGSTRIVRLMVQ